MRNTTGLNVHRNGICKTQEGLVVLGGGLCTGMLSRKVGPSWEAKAQSCHTVSSWARGQVVWGVGLFWGDRSWLGRDLPERRAMKDGVAACVC